MKLSVQYFLVGCAIVAVTLADNLRYRAYYNDIGQPPEDALLDLIARYGQTIIRAKNDLENSKRTVDFGLSRGYSGAQEAKHRMAMAIANFAGGPGKRSAVSPVVEGADEE